MLVQAEAKSVELSPGLPHELSPGMEGSCNSNWGTLLHNAGSQSALLTGMPNTHPFMGIFKSQSDMLTVNRLILMIDGLEW